MNLETILSDIGKHLAVFQAESKKHSDGNKAAGARARKATLELDKLFKQYRKLSV